MKMIYGYGQQEQQKLVLNILILPLTFCTVGTRRLHARTEGILSLLHTAVQLIMSLVMSRNQSGLGTRLSNVWGKPC